MSHWVIVSTKEIKVNFGEKEHRIEVPVYISLTSKITLEVNKALKMENEDTAKNLLEMLNLEDFEVRKLDPVQRRGI